MSAAPAFDPEEASSPTQAAIAVLESRSDYRVGADFPVEIHSPHFDPPLAARARDVSAGGVCVATPSPFVLDGVHALTLHLPTGPLRLNAGGRWQKSVGQGEAILSGMSFVDFSPEHVAQVWDVVHDTSRTLGSFVYKSLSGAEPTIEDAMSVAQMSRLRSVGRHRYIYQRDERMAGDDSIFLVKSGQVQLTFPMSAGRDITVAVLGPGDLFGGLAAVAGTMPMESAQAVEETMLLEVSRATFSYTRLAKPLLAHWLGALVMKASIERVAAVVDRTLKVLRP